MPELHRADLTDASVVLALLDEASAWLRSRGIEQWPERWELGWIEPTLVRGETWIARIDGRVAGTITLADSDPIWDDEPAGYVHRLAICRWAAGLGASLLEWAAAETVRRGGLSLRLDCVASNPALRAYYEAAGFVHRGDVDVTGPPGDRKATGPPVLVSRYERPLLSTEARRGQTQ